ncbi:MAG: type I DNA topoisomerase [Acidobacteria bacterium]|nr:MAG: type I DNA topoisomerase [Acidobacteriota bacterium]
MAAKKSLVIVESPAKANTINKYLGKEFVVKASLGHVKDLPKSKLGVDIKNDFEPVYELIPGKEKVVKELRTAAKGAERIFLAADPDREGEAICQHLKEILDDHKGEVFRVLFNEITPKAIRAAMEKPGRINQHIVDAQQARRILDRLVGYQISPLLWDKVRRGISAGRVQTVALRMIVEREREILAFTPEEYWSIIAKLEGREPPPFSARLVKIKGKIAEVKNQAEADHILEVVKKSEFLVESVVTKEKKRNPVPPFTTSKLQQDAARRLRFTVKKTMMLAQRLYEGVELGDEGRVGLITYMRTDSTRISDEAMEMVRSYVSDVYGSNYLPEKPVFYKTKKDAQDAHEAIRPTFVGRTPDDLKPYLGEDELKLYRLIWTRFVASQMNPAVYDQTTIEISAKDYLFRENGRVLKFDGFLKVYEESTDDDIHAKPTGDEEDDIALPPLTVGEKLRLLDVTPRQHFTEPPPRYTEASLVKVLEEKGIGRPSTYASILTTIQDREYVTKDQGKFRPTELGTVVTDMLVKHFEDIFDIQYTARMEEELDEVEDGKMTWVEALDEFYKKFEKDLKKASKNMENLKRQEIPTDEVCEKCGSPMVKKWGQFGSFLACSAYPECKNTKELALEEPPKEGQPAADADPEPCENCGRPMALKRGRFGQFLACTGYPECKTTRKIAQAGRAPKKPDVILDETCPKCGQAKLAMKEGRFGEFIACSNYPKCKYIKPKTVGVPCPKAGCGGELIERRSKRGKVFYGCAKYPDCDFVAWNKPVPEQCPQCGAPYLLEKSTKREGLVRYCNEESCKYKVSVEPEQVSS